MSPPPRNRTPTRKALHERSDSATNIRPAVRLVPYTPPRLSGAGAAAADNHLYSRTPLPTLPSHFLPPATTAAAATGAACPGFAAALEQSGNDVSPDLFPAKPQAPPGSGVTTPLQPQQGDHSRPSTANSTRSNPRLKKRKHVALNPDNKTFRVLDADWHDEAQNEGVVKSPSSIASFSSHGRLSFDPPSIDAPSRSPVSCAHQSTAATTPDIPGRESMTPSSPDLISDSPWNYRFVGGLRKVPKTPDLKQKAVSSSEPLPPPLPEISEDPKALPLPDLSTKLSFQSTSSDSAASETTNYKVYGSSPTPYEPAVPPSSSSDSDQQMTEHSYREPQAGNYPDIAPPSSSESNYQILGYSSPSSSGVDLPSENYQLHRDPSSSPLYATVSSPAAPSYSRESLVVPPLQPRLRRSTERFGYYKSRSRESLRTGSLTSISSVLSQETAQLLSTRNPLTQHPISSSQAAPSSWAPSIALNPPRSHMQPYPHQWSSQLSTVPSESDSTTDRDSRSWSDGNGRRNSGFPSSHSRQMASISSSLPREEGHSRTNSLEHPQPIYTRSSPRLVEDQDEYGDGITDMQDLRLRSSRPRLSDFYSVLSDSGRTNTMRSTTSSRTNSLLSSSIPTWARLYYGSGERRYLGAPGSSTEGTDSRPQSSMRSGSPDSSNFPLGIYSPRKRPRQVYPSTGRPSSNRGGSMEISPLPELDNGDSLIYNSFRRHFRPSSSILSPHLKRDKRATRTSRFFSEPASVDWSSGGNVFRSRRERLIIMFITGFIFPPAWIVGAFLPLPPNPELLMIEKAQNTSNLYKAKGVARELGPTDVLRYESARWWRNLNRGMAVLGVLIIAVIIILAIVGVKQGWAK